MNGVDNTAFSRNDKTVLGRTAGLIDHTASTAHIVRKFHYLRMTFGWTEPASGISLSFTISALFRVA